MDFYTWTTKQPWLAFNRFFFQLTSWILKHWGFHIFLLAQTENRKRHSWTIKTYIFQHLLIPNFFHSLSVYKCTELSSPPLPETFTLLFSPYSDRHLKEILKLNKIIIKLPGYAKIHTFKMHLLPSFKMTTNNWVKQTIKCCVRSTHHFNNNSIRCPLREHKSQLFCSLH